MKILIVDDHPDAAEILEEGAKLFGCEQIDVVDSGEDAIGKAILEEYDLITLDIRMPGVSGLDALSVIRGLRSHSILAVISAYTKDIDPEALSGADIVLAKPVPLERFQQILQLTQEISERRAAIQELGNL